MSTRNPPITTADQLLAAAHELGPCELVRGELIMMTPAGEKHSQIEGNLYLAIAGHVKANTLGRVYMGDAGFLIDRDPDTVRAPDVSFVRASRVRPLPHDGYFPGVPDLAVGIRSPEDRPKAIDAKIEEYLRFGVQVVWDVDPDRRTVTVHRRGEAPQVLGEDASIAAPELLPGFSMPVREIFAW